jgi:hypothetical protein
MPPLRVAVGSTIGVRGQICMDWGKSVNQIAGLERPMLDCPCSPHQFANLPAWLLGCIADFSAAGKSPAGIYPVRPLHLTLHFSSGSS